MLGFGPIAAAALAALFGGGEEGDIWSPVVDVTDDWTPRADVVDVWAPRTDVADGWTPRKD